ncbi:hypothetical protein SM139_0562, partial [Stenotrophomonas maltophilia]
TPPVRYASARTRWP